MSFTPPLFCFTLRFITSCTNFYSFVLCSSLLCSSYYYSLGPVSLCPGCTSALGLLCSPKHSIQHRFSNPVPLIKRQRSLTEAVLISFGSAVNFPKTLALMSQHLAAAGNMLHCFSLHPAESAGCIPIKQAHNTQVLSHRNMSCEDRNYHF
jgi:hypothetical protein